MRRPDLTDRAEQADRLRAAIARLEQPYTPPPGWRLRPRARIRWGDLPLLRALITTEDDMDERCGRVTNRQLMNQLEDIKERLGLLEKTARNTERKVTHMSVNVDKLNSDIQTLVAGYQAVVAERDALKDALASADADKAQAVADAVAAEDADAQSKIDAADAVVDAVNNPAPPADSGSGDVPPADGGDVPADGSGDTPAS